MSKNYTLYYTTNVLNCSDLKPLSDCARADHHHHFSQKTSPTRQRSSPRCGMGCARLLCEKRSRWTTVCSYTVSVAIFFNYNNLIIGEEAAFLCVLAGFTSPARWRIHFVVISVWERECSSVCWHTWKLCTLSKCSLKILGDSGLFWWCVGWLDWERLRLQRMYVYVYASNWSYYISPM